MNENPPIMEAWRHTIALLPQAALAAMDEFYREMGLDPDGRHAFPCAAGKHETAMKFAYSGAWTADKTETIDELAADRFCWICWVAAGAGEPLDGERQAGQPQQEMR